MRDTGVQIGPRAGLGVRFGTDPADPERFLVRGAQPRVSAVVALAFVAVIGIAQIEAVRRGSAWQVGLFSLLSCGATAVALVRRRLVLLPRSGVLREELAMLVPFAVRPSPLRRFKGVRVSREGLKGRRDRFAIDLVSPGGDLPVDRVGVWERAAPLAEALARFLEVPLLDAHRPRLEVSELDRPLRDRPAEAAPGAPPARLAAWIEVDRPELLRVRIPRPGVLLALLMLLTAALFSTVALTVEVLVPMLRGWHPQSLGQLTRLVVPYLVPFLLVAGAVLQHVARNGGVLSVTQDALRFCRFGLLRAVELEIPAGELEDLALLQPEMGGSRSLLAYASEGVLVARSDAIALRVGYGLRADELDWLRLKILQVVRRAPPHRDESPTRPAATAGEELPVFPSWWRVGLATVTGGILGRLAGGPLGLCAAWPFLEDVLNVGALLGALAGLALSPHLLRARGSRALVVLVAAACVVGGGAVLLRPAGWVQPAPGVDEVRLVRGEPAAGEGPAVSEARLHLGFALSVLAANAVALNAVLILVVLAFGGSWRSGLPGMARDLRARSLYVGVVPRRAGLALLLGGLLLSGLAVGRAAAGFPRPAPAASAAASVPRALRPVALAAAATRRQAPRGRSWQTRGAYDTDRRAPVRPEIREPSR